jgi:hypothetical protein
VAGLLVLSSVCCAADSVGEPATTNASPESALDAPPAGFYIRLTSNTSLPVDMQDLVLNIGQFAPLFDQTYAHYIAVLPAEDGSDMLVAFPRMNSRGQGTAWVSGEKQIIFGSPTHSVASRVALKAGSRFPVVQEDDTSYEVLTMKHGRLVTLHIPKYAEGLVKEPYVPPAPAETNHLIRIVDHSRPAEAAAVRTVDVSSGTGAAQRLALRSALRTASPAANAVATTAKSDSGAPAGQTVAPAGTAMFTAQVLDPPAPAASATEKPPAQVTASATASVVVAASAPDSEPAGAAATTNATALAGASSPRPSAEAPSATEVIVANTANASMPSQPPLAISLPPTSGSDDLSILQYVHFGALGVKILLLTVVMEGMLVVGMGISNRRRTRATNSLLDIPPADVPAAQDSVSKIPPRSSHDLSGTLDSFSMGQVVQFFCAAGESGVLTIVNGNPGETDMLVFDRGQIIDAKVGDKIGNEAANIVLRRQHGSFCFKRQDVSSLSKIIEQDTMSMLLDAHRVIDEQGWSN